LEVESPKMDLEFDVNFQPLKQIDSLDKAMWYAPEELLRSIRETYQRLKSDKKFFVIPVPIH
jgi:hypothetical protein